MKTKLKGKIKEGMILIDDVNITYKVVDVFKNSAVVIPLKNIDGNFSAEIMTFESMENEGWIIPNLS
jgi:cell shape-determining protein MreC